MKSELGRRLFLRMAAGALAAGMLRADLTARRPALEEALDEVTYNLRLRVVGGGGGGYVGDGLSVVGGGGGGYVGDGLSVVGGGGGGWFLPAQRDGEDLEVRSVLRVQAGGEGPGPGAGTEGMTFVGGRGMAGVYAKRWRDDEPEPTEWTHLQ